MKERAAINNILTGLKWALKESLLSPHIDYKYRLNEVVPYVPLCLGSSRIVILIGPVVF